MKTPEEKSGYWSVNYLNKLANGDVPLSETALRQCAEYIEAAYQAADILESRLAQVERELDAALTDIANYAHAGTICKHYATDCDFVEEGCPLYPSVCGCYEWRGVCPENTKEEA